jgi:hypothetical protein
VCKLTMVTGLTTSRTGVCDGHVASPPLTFAIGGATVVTVVVRVNNGNY